MKKIPEPGSHISAEEMLNGICPSDEGKHEAQHIGAVDNEGGDLNKFICQKCKCTANMNT